MEVRLRIDVDKMDSHIKDDNLLISSNGIFICACVRACVCAHVRGSGLKPIFKPDPSLSETASHKASHRRGNRLHEFSLIKVSSQSPPEGSVSA